MNLLVLQDILNLGTVFTPSEYIMGGAMGGAMWEAWKGSVSKRSDELI